MRNIALNRQLLGVEDLLLGIGVLEQTRGGVKVNITKLNALNIPFDDVKTIADILNEKLDTDSYTAQSVLARLLTVDGHTSGLDADLLDGQEGSWYQQLLESGVNIKTLNGLSLLGSGDFQLTVGSGGYAANVYLTNLTSITNASYKQLSYSPDVAEVILNGTANNNEVLIYSSIFDGDVKATGIPSGEWGFHFHRKVDNISQLSRLRFDIYKRSSAGVETVLFSTYSNDINDTTYVREDLLITQPSYTVVDTDRIGLKVYASTTRTSNTVISFKIGDGEASFINTPLQLRHNQLRARDEVDAHPISAITGLQTLLDSKIALGSSTSNLMTKAQFNALAEERKTNRAGSGFDEMGQHHITVATYPNVNTGMWTSPTSPNIFALGREVASSAGISKTAYPLVIVNGVMQKISCVNYTLTANTITLPTAPNIYPYNTVLTAEQIASGVIKHADASNSGLVVNGKGLSGTTYSQTVTVVNGKKYIIEYKDSGVRKTLEIIATSTSYNIALTGTNITEVGMYPADAISRSDLVFLESWHEDVSEKNFVYPLGNVQYLGANTDGLTGIANGAFTGFETYSLFGNWQTSSALIGKGYAWSSLTEAQRKAFIANPENNCYLDGDKTVQVRYRIRVVQGYSDNLFNVDTQITSASGYMQSGNNSGVYVYPKGKKTSILYDQGGETTTYGVYGTKYTPWTSSLTWNDNGVFIASSSTGSTTGFTIGSYNGQCFALPIALVHRKNQGMHHNVYNPNGSKKASDSNFWYNTSVSFTSISDCFDPAKLLTASGYIGTVSGRPDGLFYDQVHEGDILDLRNSSNKVEDYNRLISREFNKLVAGTNRGKEGSMELKNYLTSTVNTKAQYTYAFGSCTYVKLNTVPPSGFSQEGYLDDSFTIFIKGNTKWYKAVSASTVNNNIILHPMYGNVTADFTVANSIDVLFIKKSTRTKSNTLLHCDIIGNPTNYPTSWKQNVVFGTPLIVAEDGTSLVPDGILDTFKLSKKANATPLLCLRSTDNGATWTSFTPTFSTTTNTITLTDEPAVNLVVIYYQTHTSMATPYINSEVLELGIVYGTTYNASNYGALLTQSMLGKVPVGVLTSRYNVFTSVSEYQMPSNRLLYSGHGVPVLHNSLALSAEITPTVKVLPYLTRLNGKAYLNLVFKEMKYNGTSWGDDSKFNIVDNVSTTTDTNAQNILIGQKTVELPYFIGADE